MKHIEEFSRGPVIFANWTRGKECRESLFQAPFDVEGEIDTRASEWSMRVRMHVQLHVDPLPNFK